MSLEIINNAPVYTCFKGDEPFNPYNTLIKTINFKSEDGESSYVTSPRSKVSAKVALTCPNCGIDYLTKIYTGDNMKVLYLCICGKNYNHEDITGLDKK